MSSHSLKESDNSWHRFYLSLSKPLHILGWTLFTIIAIYVPVYFAQTYEQWVYSLPTASLSKYEISHYSQMISFAYQVAALATVLIGYLCIKKLHKVIKTPGKLKLYYQQHPEEAEEHSIKMLWYKDVKKIKDARKEIKNNKTITKGGQDNK